MTIVHIDFETRSELDVTKVGASKYSRHHSTEIISLAFVVDDEDFVYHTATLDGNETIQKLKELALSDGVIFKAHNAYFERCVWRECLSIQEVPLERWQCTAAKATAHALPRDLKRVGQALDLPVKKDMSGHSKMLKLSKPRRPTKTNADLFWYPHTAPEDFAQLYAYNIDDVLTERCLDKALRDLSKTEQAVWRIDQKMNDRGVHVNRQQLERILHLMAQRYEELREEMEIATDFSITSPTSFNKLLEWFQSQGVNINNIQSGTLEKLIEHPKCPPNVKTVAEIRLEYGLASVKKYKAMTARMDEDARIRDILLYYGASTGRWSARGVQFQNLKRPVIDVEECLSYLSNATYEEFSKKYPKVINALGSMVRSVITPEEGKEFLCADYSSIEPRVLAWLAGQGWKLDLFKNGADLYCISASKIFNYEVTKEKHPEQRQVGKTSELALGYNGGIAAYSAMANNYRINLYEVYKLMSPSFTPAEKENAAAAITFYRERGGQLSNNLALVSDVIKQRWRKDNAEVVNLWEEVEAAAINAVRTGKQVVVGGTDERPKIIFATNGRFLYCKLPSGRCLAYYDPKLQRRPTPWGDAKITLTYMSLDSMTNKWIRKAAYGGLFVENIVQAISRDIMAEAMIRLEREGFPLILTVHDELIAEVTIKTLLLSRMIELMTQQPKWAPGLPIEASGWQGFYYRK